MSNSRDNAARRNRSLRKIRAAQHIDPEIKLAIQVILDLLSPKSAYQVAWPSAATIAGRLGRSRRTGKWYVRIIKALGIFNTTQRSPSDARAYCDQKYGFKPRLDRCTVNATILFEPNLDHPLWDSSVKLPAELDEAMGGIIQEIKSKRNSKTTSRFASNPDLKPRKKLLNDVANDTIDDVANDTQVLKRFSVESNDVVASPSKPFNAPTSPCDSITTGVGGSQPCSRVPRANTPPAHQSARDSVTENEGLPGDVLSDEEILDLETHGLACGESGATASQPAPLEIKSLQQERGTRGINSRWSQVLTIPIPSGTENPWDHSEFSQLGKAGELLRYRKEKEFFRQFGR